MFKVGDKVKRNLQDDYWLFLCSRHHKDPSEIYTISQVEPGFQLAEFLDAAPHHDCISEYFTIVKQAKKKVFK